MGLWLGSVRKKRMMRNISYKNNRVFIMGFRACWACQGVLVCHRVLQKLVVVPLIYLGCPFGGGGVCIMVRIYIVRLSIQSSAIQYKI